MIAIIDYGVGNLFSLKSSFDAIGEKAIVTADRQIIRDADRIIFPGVGAFRDASEKLKASGLDQVIREEAASGKPLMGICLGMQLLFEKGYEYGEYDGVGLIRGNIRPIADVIPADLKIPHMGWNALILKKECPLFEDIRNGDHVYFVHSYYAADCEEAVTATAEYGAELTAAAMNGNVFGCQFHPEKSGETGMKILRSFCHLEVKA